jgi:PIN domain nuclease of toxin-antitoxin system
MGRVMRTRASVPSQAPIIIRGGKLNAPDDVIERIEQAETELLTITARHAHAAGALPLHHRDPFDRLLVAQAKLERCAIVTGDGAVGAYDVPVVW